MRKIYYEIKDSYKQYDYVTTLEKIEKYLSIPGIGVDGSLLLYYMNTMCRLGRLDDGYKIYKILDKYYGGYSNWKLIFANKCYANDRFDLLEKIFSNTSNNDVDLEYLWIKALFMYGEYDKCLCELDKFFQKHENDQISLLVISNIDRIRNLLQYRDNGNNFVHTMYSNFLKEGNVLQGGDIVYFNKFMSDYEQENGVYKAYIVYKVVGDMVYAFSTSNKYDDKVIDCRKYLNIGSKLSFSGDIVKTELSSVMEVKERLSQKDFMKVCRYIYIKLHITGVIYNDNVLDFLNDYNIDNSGVKVRDVLIYINNRQKKYYYLIDIIDDKYKVVLLNRNDKGLYVETGEIEYIDRNILVYDNFSVSSFCRKKLYYDMRNKILKKEQ